MSYWSRIDLMKVGYARVSTEEQSLALQIDALARAGCVTIFRDAAVSGAKSNRPSLDLLLQEIQPGDVLVTWRLDRLGRSLSHLIDLVSGLKDRGVGFISLCEAIDTETASGRLLFHVMGALAEFERALISERTRAGMLAARERGAALGRPRRLASAQVEAARSTLRSGAATVEELARTMRVSRPTLARAMKRV
jgi:DNA invertase Pin-like site-specific DNA recombinase